MKKPWFVILKCQNGENFTPLMNGEELVQFETDEEACSAAEKSTFGHEFGFEIFNMDVA